MRMLCRIDGVLFFHTRCLLFANVLSICVGMMDGEDHRDSTKVASVHSDDAEFMKCERPDYKGKVLLNGQSSLSTRPIFIQKPLEWIEKTSVSNLIQPRIASLDIGGGLKDLLT